MSSFAEQTTVDQAVEAGDTSNTIDTRDQEFSFEAAGRKYSSLDDVKTKVENQETHISKLEQEAEARREELAMLRAKLEESTKQSEVLARKAEEGETRKGLDPNELDSVVTSKVQELKRQDIRQANHAECSQALKDTYGDSYIAKLKALAEAEDLTMDEVDEIAYSKPKLFKRLFLTGQSGQSNNGTTSSTVRTANFQDTPKQSNVKAPLNLNGSKARTNNYLAALEEYLSN